MLLIHPSWSRAVPKHPPGPRESFSTILHLKSKIEKQVSFSVDLPNAFFKLVKQPTFQKWILWSKFRFFKKNLNIVLGVQDGRKRFSGTQGVLWDRSGPTRMDQEHFGRKNFFDFFYNFFKHFASIFNMFLKDCSHEDAKK